MLELLSGKFTSVAQATCGFQFSKLSQCRLVWEHVGGSRLLAFLSWKRPEDMWVNLCVGDSVSAAGKARLFRYELPVDRFDPLDDAGMFVSRVAVEPLAVVAITDLPAALDRSELELRVMRSLAPLTDVWSTSLHASGIRLRHARIGPEISHNGDRKLKRHNGRDGWEAGIHPIPNERLLPGVRPLPLYVRQGRLAERLELAEIGPSASGC